MGAFTNELPRHEGWVCRRQSGTDQYGNALPSFTHSCWGLGLLK